MKLQLLKPKPRVNRLAYRLRALAKKQTNEDTARDLENAATRIERTAASLGAAWNIKMTQAYQQGLVLWRVVTGEHYAE